MNTNVLFLSPRSIKPDYLPVLFQALHVERIVSFLSIESMPAYLADEVMAHPFCVLDDSLPDFAVEEAVRLLSQEILDRVMEGGLQGDARKGVIRNGTIVILADWQMTYASQYEQYYHWLRKHGGNYGAWTYECTCYPYSFRYGNLPDLLVDDLNTVLGQSNQFDLWNHINILQTSVFFSPMKETSLAYSHMSRRWFEPKFGSKNKPSKQMTLVLFLMRLVARTDEERFVYMDDEGNRRMFKAVSDEVIENLKSWSKDHHEYECRLAEMEARRQWDDCNDDDSDVERGCGNGWTCDNCPNFGCPANEMN